MLEEQVYDIVKKIPRGKVATYGQIASLVAGKRFARAVGNILHNNVNKSEIPCYRVVNSKGELSKSYAFGGEDEQARLLIADGIKVVDGKVDLKKYLWNVKHR